MPKGQKEPISLQEQQFKAILATPSSQKGQYVLSHLNFEKFKQAIGLYCEISKNHLRRRKTSVTHLAAALQIQAALVANKGSSLAKQQQAIYTILDNLLHSTIAKLAADNEKSELYELCSKYRDHYFMARVQETTPALLANYLDVLMSLKLSSRQKKTLQPLKNDLTVFSSAKELKAKDNAFHASYQKTLACIGSKNLQDQYELLGHLIRYTIRYELAKEDFSIVQQEENQRLQTTLATLDAELLSKKQILLNQEREIAKQAQLLKEQQIEIHAQNCVLACQLEKNDHLQQELASAQEKLAKALAVKVKKIDNDFCSHENFK